MDVRLVGYGEALDALRAAVSDAKAGDPLAPITVVVPSNHVGVAARRALATRGTTGGRGQGLAAVSFVTPFRLAELLGAATLAGEGKRPVSTPVLSAAIRAELAADPGIFAPVAEHPATESALVATYQELRDLSSEALDRLAATSRRAGEVVRLHRAARRRLEPAWSDEEDLLVTASLVDARRAQAVTGSIVIHLPQRLTRHSAALLTALAEQVPTTVIAGMTNHPGADSEVHRALTRLGIDVDALGPPTIPAPVHADRTRIVTTSDSEDEVRAAVRAVVDAVRAGTRLDRIALLHASPEPYARLAHDQLHAADIPTNGVAVQPVAARVAGRTLLGLLALPSGGYRRQDVFAWLTSAPILSDGRPVPTTAWERVSRDAAVVSGPNDWDQRLADHATELEQQADEAERDDDQPEWLAERDRDVARRARDLRRFVLSLIADLRAAAAEPRTWRQHSDWASRHLTGLLGSDARRARWSDPAERRAAERVEQALARLAALDAVEGPVSLQVFTRTLTVELEHDLGRVGRFGEGVLVGSVEMGIGLDLDLVIVLGLAEGTFPATVRDDSLLPDAERTATGAELPQRAERVDRQHRHLLAALAGARSQVLGVPRGDLRRSVERVPSRWVLDLATHLARSTGVLDPTRRWWARDLLDARVPWVHHVASFDHGLRELASPATAQEHRLRTLLAAGGSLAATDDATTALGVAAIEARRSSAFTRFDGNLAGLAVPSPLDRATSPTRLEAWAGCPHRHLVEDLLRAPPVENPEDNLEITALDRGSLVHAALEDFLLEVLHRPAAERPAPNEAWTAADHTRLQQIGARHCDSYEARGLVGRPVFWKRARLEILRDLDRALHEDSRHRAADQRAPVAAERAFGFPSDALPPVELALPDGRSLRVRGRIDRIDLGTDGTVHVIDYKTGKAAKVYKALSPHDPVGGGTKLQLPFYGLAGRLEVGDTERPVRAQYWFVTSAGEFTTVGYDVTDEVLAATAEVVGQLVSGIEAGVFPPHPGERSTFFRIECHACDPDGLGTAELRKQWDRKRSDPALARYADLVEPPDEAPDPSVAEAAAT